MCIGINTKSNSSIKRYHQLNHLRCSVRRRYILSTLFWEQLFITIKTLLVLYILLVLICCLSWRGYWLYWIGIYYCVSNRYIPWPLQSSTIHWNNGGYMYCSEMCFFTQSRKKPFHIIGRHDSKLFQEMIIILVLSNFVEEFQWFHDN